MNAFYLEMERYEEHIKATWPDERQREALRECMCRLTIPWPRFRERVKMGHGVGRSLVVVGERSYDDQQMIYAFDVMRRFRMTDRPNTDTQLLFTGGIHHRMAYGEYPAHVLARHFKRVASAYGMSCMMERANIDLDSDNTGAQCWQVAAKIQASRFAGRPYRSVFLVLPMDHIVRFAAVLVGAFEKASLRDVCIIPVAYGYTEQREGILPMHREAFGPRYTISDDEDPVQVDQRCGQYTDRWAADNLSWRSGELFVGPVCPVGLLNYLNANSRWTH